MISRILAYKANVVFSVPHLCPTTAIKRDTGDNYLLKAANIKKILSVLNEFYTLELGITETDLEVINANSIAKEGNTSEILKLVELVLGAAVECENKKEYIENIMLLDETSQRDLMVIIERVRLNPANTHQKTHLLILSRR